MKSIFWIILLVFVSLNGFAQGYGNKENFQVSISSEFGYFPVKSKYFEVYNTSLSGTGQITFSSTGNFIKVDPQRNKFLFTTYVKYKFLYVGKDDIGALSVGIPFTMTLDFDLGAALALDWNGGSAAQKYTERSRRWGYYVGVGFGVRSIYLLDNKYQSVEKNQIPASETIQVLDSYYIKSPTIIQNEHLSDIPNFAYGAFVHGGLNFNVIKDGFPKTIMNMLIPLGIRVMYFPSLKNESDLLSAGLVFNF